jgi:putative addiction module killer protein
MGEAQPQHIEMDVTPDDRVPFEEWLLALRHTRARARIRVRIDPLSLGNPGDAHPVGVGVSDLRIDYGPGYRVYFAQSGPTTLLLLWGGDKSTQAGDIRKARDYWVEYQRRRREHDEAH